MSPPPSASVPHLLRNVLATGPFCLGLLLTDCGSRGALLPTPGEALVPTRAPTRGTGGQEAAAGKPGTAGAPARTGGTGGSTSAGQGGEGGTADRASQRVVGFRASRYGLSPFPDPAYFLKTGTTYQSQLAPTLETTPAALWIVGTTDGNNCQLSFPAEGKSASNVRFSNAESNEAYLSAFDSAGFKVWLQVEPAHADLPTLIDLVLSRYGRHPSVVGFGVDVEWFKSSSGNGTAVSDADARTWRDRVRQHSTAYSLFLKHWLPEMLPATEREGLFFIDDSQQFTDQEQLVQEFQLWGSHFAPAPVGFQIGYTEDKAWWSKLPSPPKDLALTLFDRVPGTRGVFWVDFSLKEVFP